MSTAPCGTPPDRVEVVDVRKLTPRDLRGVRTIVHLAAHKSVNVVVYARADIKAAFKTIGASTRQEIACAVARHVEAFQHRLPKPRKPWQSEDRRMALFSAAALVLTHYQLGASTLFDDLSLDGAD